MKNTTYCIYARVSERGSDWKEKGIETSCASQIADCREYIASHDSDGEVISVIQDEFISGKTNDRPGLQRILAELRDGAEWDVLVVIDMDRLTRSIVEATRILEPLHEAGKGLMSVKQNWDFSTPIGRMMMWQCIAWSQFFREDMGDKTKRRMLYIARQGMWPAGNVPRGYKRAGKRDNRLVVDPRPAEQVKAAFTAYANGQTAQQVCNTFDLPKNTLLKMLRNPVYIGRIRYASVDVEGLHDGIIPTTLWKAVQERLPKTKSGARPNAAKYDYLLTGLIRCQCGRAMSPAGGKGRHGGQFAYYRCTDARNCPHRSYVPAPELENALLKQIWSMEYNGPAIEKLATKLKERLLDLKSAMAPEVMRIRDALAAATTEEVNLRRMMTDGLVTKENADYWNKSVSKVTGELERLNQEKAEAELKIESAYPHLTDPIAMAKEWRKLSRQLSRSDDASARRTVLQANIGSILRTEKGFDIEFHFGGSTNCPLWHPMGVLVQMGWRVA